MGNRNYRKCISLCLFILNGQRSVFRSLTTSSLNKLMRAVRIRQHTGTLKRSHMQSMKMRIQLCQDPIQQIPEEEESLRKNRERRLPPIGFQEQPRELQRNCPASKAFTRIKYLCNHQFQPSA
ncbi:PREDICTED: uncharacterized protein LOC105149921 [Acromyrmex echinatior]|uniref:uncharacterized protein LOC105149921 n=1 Tax=Acromyrmex echinatior TaxID=103372 RepID=UPI000580F4B9|nr:PREDICTED: uncharacterized protein LOC105149921 [Acromyrmex echinatior]